ncbi:hypothetical protein AYO20_05812 [Fonsecaea nubica]|uniref:Uncharacterized protein n=1 Tax=Fonsecaea nubica TaxID=856822 RepID=A0A178D049_9EURO|nr:hypothetical protein AYO20_05812 [Fonsecaea nubica]OAL34852.1 hypothetical protein AYO20_05812 [Fonsecaea nubica]
MPRPAKPPMTLKEAKRAYKKEGGFRYTASQMARADRLDAREEKRKKELEKERQRAENKRKREEKLEKERIVRQKMLDEGRINVEDTWGKVTASQPRLNKFFGHKPALRATKETTGDQPVVEDEDMQAAGSTAEDPEEPPHLQEVRSPPQTFAEVAPPDVDDYQQGRSNGSTVHASPIPSLNLRQSPKLRELRPSQINSQRLKPRQYANEGKVASPERLVGIPRPRSTSPKAETTASFKEHPKSPSTFSKTNEISGQSPLEIRLPQDEVGSISHESNKATKGSDTSEDSLGASKVLLDEDFTEGIDDETFLMLCATQKSLPDDLSTRENSQSTSPLGSNLGCDPPGCEASPVTLTTAPISPSRVPLSKSLSESFNSVFNEIEDEDLIALVQEVEAEIDTPKQTPTPLTRAGKTALMGPPLAPGPKAPETTRKSQSLDTEIKLQKSELQSARLKGKRRLPWDLPRDDFVDLGPSTQALTLELLEQAEAKMR